jgi:hypothetical protein
MSKGIHVTKRSTPLFLATLLAATALAGCSRHDEPETPPADTNMAVEEIAPPEAAPTPEPMPTAAPSPIENVAALPDSPPPAPDEQMLDDASVTGMTARANRDAADEQAPAEKKQN